MYSENGLIIDLDEVRKVVAEADVFGVGFRSFENRLFVDTRSNAVDDPFIAVVEPLHSMQERVLWLGQNRPRFGMPQRFAFFFWPHSIEMLQESGLWQAIRDRAVEHGAGAAERAADRALTDLVRREHEAAVDAIRGDGHQTLWQSETSRYQG